MALKGNLATVSLADVFQVLSHGRSNGLLRVQAPEGTRFVEITNGAISIVSRQGNRIPIGDLLVSRGQLTEDQLKQALSKQKESGKLFGEVLLDLHLVERKQIEEVLRFQVEEELCDLFLLKSAEFDFLANATLDANMALGGGFIRLSIDPNSILLEAARRVDEWQRLEARIASQACVFKLTDSGQQMLDSGEGLSFEGMAVLKLCGEHRSVESIVQKTCLGRLNSNIMLCELWDHTLLEPLAADEYAKIAAEHLAKGRLDEAERVASYALKVEGDDKRQAALQKTLDEVTRKKKLAAPSEASASTRVRSEVIKRPNAALVIKKHKTPWIPVAIGGVVLLGIAGAIWFFYFRSDHTDVAADIAKRYETIHTQVDELIKEHKYKEAIDLLAKPPSDPIMRQKIDDLYKTTAAKITSDAQELSSSFQRALDKNDQAQLEKCVNDAKDFAHVTLPRQEDFQKLTDTLKRIEAWRREKAGELQLKRLQELARTEKTDAEAALQEILAILKADPTEPVAAQVRARLQSLYEGKLAAEKALQDGALAEAAGDLTTADEQYHLTMSHYPGSALAKKAMGKLADIQDRKKKVATELENLPVLLTQKAYKEVRDKLLKIIDSKPGDDLTDRAREMLSRHEVVVQEDEIAANALLTNANRVKELQGPKAEILKLKKEILTKYPYTKAATQVTFDLQIDSQPKGASISINSRQQRETTPATVSVPGQGSVRIQLRLKGYDDYVTYITPSQSLEPLVARMDRQQIAPTRRMPTAASGGFVANEAVVAWAAGSELMLFNLKDAPTSALRRVQVFTAGGETPAPIQNPIFSSTKQGEADVLVTSEFGLHRILPETSKLYSWPLQKDSGRSLSTPVPMVLHNVASAGLATESGFELLDLADGKPTIPAKFIGKVENKVSTGLVYDDAGKWFYLPRSDGKLLCLSADNQGEISWETTLPSNLVGELQFNAAEKALAIATDTGKVLVLESKDGKPRFEYDTKGNSKLGIFDAPMGFLVPLDNGHLILLSPKESREIWNIEVPGGIATAPVSIGKKYVGVCSATELLIYSAFDGSPVWHAPLPAPPQGISFGGNRVFVATPNPPMLLSFPLE